MNNIYVNKAGSDTDILIIEILAQKIWTQHYIPIIGKDQVAYMLERFQSFPAIKCDIENGYTYYIVYANDRPCGYSAVKIDNGVFLSKFYVEEAARGAGAGKAMLSSIIEYAKEHGQGRIWLTCNKC